VLSLTDIHALLRIQEDSYRTDSDLASVWPRQSAMGAGELAALLEQCRYGVLATAQGERPIAWPVLFIVFAGSFWFGSGGAVHRDRVRGTRWASLVIIDGKPGEHRSLQADGQLSIAERAPARLPDLWRARHGLDEDWSAVWLELAPRRLFSFIADPLRD
jgi:hypothetical protein